MNFVRLRAVDMVEIRLDGFLRPKNSRYSNNYITQETSLSLKSCGNTPEPVTTLLYMNHVDYDHTGTGNFVHKLNVNSPIGSSENGDKNNKGSVRKFGPIRYSCTLVVNYSFPFLRSQLY